LPSNLCMQNYSFRSSLFFVFILVSASCSVIKKATQPTANISSIKYLGKYDIPYNLIYNNTAVGGLSGIDYDAKNNLYYMICDDRSDKSPARFYTAKIFLTQSGIDSVVFTGVKNLLQPNGTVYPNSRQDRYHVPDPEAMRYNPLTKTLTWSSEGERIVNEKEKILEDPAVIVISREGNYIDSFAMPDNLRMQAAEKGPRKNGVLEGMTFADNYKTLFVSAEEPLYEDGPRADVMENKPMIRFYQFDMATKKNVAQFAYKLEPVAYPAVPESEFKINGIPDILSIGGNKFLVIERSFSTGRLACTIKLFIANLSGARDIIGISLKDRWDYWAIQKKLLLNLDDLDIYTDNIEGMTFGPVLPNGHKTLLLIADNNFNALQKSQVLLFEVIE